MPPVIRAYSPADRPALTAALVAIQEHERTLHDTRVPGGPATEIYLGELLQNVAEKSGAIFVADGDRPGELAGIVAGYIVDDPTVNETAESNRYAYCSDIQVAPAWRGTGLARDLLDRLERHLAAQAPVRRFRITALAMNRLACRAYERAGFTPYEVIYERLIPSTQA